MVERENGLRSELLKVIARAVESGECDREKASGLEHAIDGVLGGRGYGLGPFGVGTFGSNDAEEAS